MSGEYGLEGTDLRPRDRCESGLSLKVVSQHRNPHCRSRTEHDSKICTVGVRVKVQFGVRVRCCGTELVSRLPVQGQSCALRPADAVSGDGYLLPEASASLPVAEQLEVEGAAWPAKCRA